MSNTAIHAYVKSALTKFHKPNIKMKKIQKYILCFKTVNYL